MASTRYSWMGVEPPLFGPGSPSTVSELPPIHPKRARIGIVRLCDYDPLKSSFTAIAARNSMLYARKHGYKLYMEGAALDPNRPIAWSKVSNFIIIFQLSIKYS